MSRKKVPGYFGILIADLKDYSKAGSDNVLNKIEEFITNFVETNIKDNLHHKYFNPRGDGFLVCSTTCLESANLALKFRDACLSKNWKADDIKSPIIPRIGLHFGQITTYVNQENNHEIESVVGKSIINAARIEPITVAGAVFCSEKFKLQLEDDASNNSVFIHQGTKELVKNFGDMPIYSVHWEHEITNMPHAPTEEECKEHSERIKKK